MAACFSGPLSADGLAMSPIQYARNATPSILSPPDGYEYWATVENDWYSATPPAYIEPRFHYEFAIGGWSFVPNANGWELGGVQQNDNDEPIPTVHTYHSLITIDPPSFDQLPTGSGWQPGDYNIYPPVGTEPYNWIFWRCGIRWWWFSNLATHYRMYECRYQWWKRIGYTW